MTHLRSRPRVALFLDVDGVLNSHAFVLERGKRKRPPYEGAWAIPGGFVEPHETLMEAALRELEEETSLRLPRAEQLRVFDAVDRDPRARVISVVHWTVVNAADHTPRGSDDASEAAWFDLTELPELAFDHAEVLATARRRLTNPSD